MTSGRFDQLDYEGFRKLAVNKDLSQFERIGFPDNYRDGHEGAIFNDIRTKLPKLDGTGYVILDIGPGCSDLPKMLITHCETHGHHLTLADSAEMLELLPNSSAEQKVDKIPGRFPDTANKIRSTLGQADVILCYSVIQYAVAEDILNLFFDSALDLLAEGGEMLIGDLPNASMRKRFFSSNSGQAFHYAFSGKENVAVSGIEESEEGKINDEIIFELLSRARATGSHAFVVPQPDELPMANRREDILIKRP